MLDILCGNKNIEKILIFLFVNGKGYGTQLHRKLQTALTPLQNALLRLEKGGVIMSYYEGKTRLYQFNPSFPLMGELEQLVKKAYTLLPAHEKKAYYVRKEPREMSGENLAHTILTFWHQLGHVKQLAFTAKTKTQEEGGWHGKGKGDVAVTKEGSTVLIFHEKGIWEGKPGEAIHFSNVFRWTLDHRTNTIALEHLRRGPEHPVFLFHLAPSGSHSLASVDSHLCEEDTYFGQVFFDRHSLRLHWRVIGPKKNEELDYIYYF